MCRAWKSNQLLVTRFRFATAENELSEVFDELVMNTVSANIVAIKVSANIVAMMS